MLVKIEDTVYKVSWKHTYPETGGKMSSTVVGKTHGSTRCTIEVIKDMTTNPYVTELVDTAVAFCHSNDQFNKSTGRKYSLRKALSKWNDVVYKVKFNNSHDEFLKYLDGDNKKWNVFVSEIKAQRKLFWDAYFKEHKQ